jgi:hypothetical protein
MPAAGAIIGAAGSLIGGNQQANAAQDAANAGAQGSRDAIAANMAFYNQSRQDNYGHMVTGNSALRRIAEMYGLDYSTAQPSWDGIQMSGGETTTDKPSFLERLHDPGGLFFQQTSETTPLSFSTGGGSGTGGGTNAGTTSGGSGNPIATGTGKADFSSFYQTPDFLVRQREGIQGLDRGAAARGRLFSGGADADRMRFSADLGAQGFGSYLNTLMGIAGLGTSANQTVGGAGQTFGSGIANASQNAGDHRASGYAGAGAARGDAWNGVGSAFGDWWGSSQQSRNNPWGGG